LVTLLAETMPTKLRTKTLKRATAAAGRGVAKATKRNMPTETGLLRVAIGQRTVGRKSKATAASIVGARTRFRSVKRDRLRGSKAKRRPSKYLHLVEFGTKPHSIQNAAVFDPSTGAIRRIPTAHHPGTKGPYPLTSAVRSTQGQQRTAMTKVVRQDMAKAITKTKRKRRKK
jgi:hypothetical protein